MDYTLPDIKRLINLGLMAEALGLEGRRGRYWCPFHDNNDNNYYYNNDNNYYYCLSSLCNSRCF
jgi:hypothetical protein